MTARTVKLDTDSTITYVYPLDGGPARFSHISTRLSSPFGRYCAQIDWSRETRRAIIARRIRETQYIHEMVSAVQQQQGIEHTHAESDAEEVASAYPNDIELGIIARSETKSALRMRNRPERISETMVLTEMDSEGGPVYEWDDDLIEVTDPFAWQNYIRYMACNGSEGILTKAIRETLANPEKKNITLEQFASEVGSEYARIFALQVMHEEMLGRVYQYISKAAASEVVAVDGSIALDMSTRTPASGYVLPGCVPDGDPPTAQQVFQLVAQYAAGRDKILRSILSSENAGERRT
jgi:hypothetical protein